MKEWPPTFRLRAAYPDAYAAAYVETHRRPVSVFFGPAHPVNRLMKNGRKTPGEEIRHARAVSR